MKKFQTLYRLFIITFVFSILLNTVVYAEGNGDSKGKDPKPLKFISCTLENGGGISSSQGIDLNSRFKLQFDKNVVNMLVWENNKNCISMVSSDNKKVRVIVTKIDDTVDFDNRQVIFVRPVGDLEVGKSYSIKISPKLIAKNGVSTLGESTGGKEVSVSFKTKGQDTTKNDKKDEEKAKTNKDAPTSNKTVKSNEQVNKDNKTSKTEEGVNSSNSGKSESENKNEDTKDSLENKEKPLETKTEEEKKGEATTVEENKDESKTVNSALQETSNGKGLTTGNYIIIGLGIVVICWIVFEVLIRRKRK